jgi:hypothetical protein
MRLLVPALPVAVGGIVRTNFPEKIRKNEALYGDVIRANALLEAESGSSGGLVRAEWDLTQDERGRDLLTLTLSDYSGEVTTRLTPADLANAGLLRVRFHRLWGDLLQVRSGKQVEKLQQLVRELGGD